MTAIVTVQSVKLSVEDASSAMSDLVVYWDARRAGRSLPTRRDLDPVDLWPWLGRVNLFERMGDGDLRVRLRGTELGNFRGHFTDGAVFGQVRPRPYAERIFLDHQETFATGLPARHRLELDLAGYRYGFDRLALPLAEGGGLPAMMLVFVEFDLRASREFWRRYVEAEDGPEAEPAFRF
jgi:PAS domain